MKIALRDFESKDFGKIKKGTKIPKIVADKMDIKSLEKAGFIGDDPKTKKDTKK